MKKIFITLSLSALAVTQASSAVLWNAGRIDDAQQWNPGNPGPGTGGEDAIFVQEAGPSNTLPGNSANTGGTGAGRDIDDDYYFAGDYSTQVDGGAAYVPVGIVGSNELNMERAWTGPDNDLRFHFNFPASVTSTDLLSISFGITTGFDQPDAIGWNVDASINGVSIFTTNIVDGDQNGDWTSPTFTLADIGNPAVGAGSDNYVQLRGTNAGSNSRWLSLDYAQLDATAVPEPSSLGLLAIAAVGLTIVRRRRR